ncbi:MAG TPA: aldo/keto reductase [Gaiellaceae bacterium]|nr:aldo/keto reductase [Gaiellaceae bacterium]
MPWLESGELRIGLGCMRLGERAPETIAAAVAAGITVFDTARAYGNEEVVARALRDVPGARIVTKGGMSRPGGAWIPDGRARAIRADCEASLAALDGRAIDLYLLHTPDPRTTWKTSVRALARLVDERLVARVGVCNVNRAQLDDALSLAPITAVQVGLSVLDDSAVRRGILERCLENDLTLMAHSPLGGPRRKRALERHAALAEIAAARGASPAEVALAWLLGLAPNVVAIPGARSPEAVASVARAVRLRLDETERERLGRPRPRAARASRRGDVVLVMGVPGAGKSRLAIEYVERGYTRLNRDERGGSLRELADTLSEMLADGPTDVVLDNTYLSRESRSHVVDAANAHDVPVRCIWLDLPLARAQVNLVERLLERFGRLPSPEELKTHARSEPGLLTPTQQMRAFRGLEPPALDEGFVAIERVEFERAPGEGRPGLFVAAVAVDSAASLDADGPVLVFDWRPDGASDEIETSALASRAAALETAVCPHPGGPPTCWCRPPLPGLVLDFARRHRVDPRRSVLIGTSPAHRTLANALGARFHEA